MTFLKGIADLLARLTTKPGWSVDIATGGRDGYVYYREPAGTISFYWEFGGGDVIAIVSADKETTWRKNHPWAAERRGEILKRVAAEVIRQQAPGCKAEILEDEGYINFRK